MQLEVRDVSKEYKRDGRTFAAVDHVSLTVNSGDFLCILGRSGSGKSALLNLMAGLLLPTSGDMLLDGVSTAGQSDKKAALLRNTTIGHIPQGQSLLPSLTVLDNIRLPFYLGKREGHPDDMAWEWLSYLEIDDLANAYPGSLSGGEMRRVAIARALMNKPAILLADEPTSDLDADNTAAIVALLENTAKAGTAVVVVTHDRSSVKAADRCYTMEKGHLLA